jgi:hypothetical protein
MAKQPSGSATSSPPKSPRKTGAGGSSSKQPENGSTFTPNYGKREMKMYLVTESELKNLFGFGIISALFFSLSIEIVKFTIELMKDLSFNSAGLSEEKIIFWKNIISYCKWTGTVLLILFFIFLFFGSQKIRNIKKENKFNR